MKKTGVIFVSNALLFSPFISGSIENGIYFSETRGVKIFEGSVYWSILISNYLDSEEYLQLKQKSWKIKDFSNFYLFIALQWDTQMYRQFLVSKTHKEKFCQDIDMKDYLFFNDLSF